MNCLKKRQEQENGLQAKGSALALLKKLSFGLHWNMMLGVARKAVKLTSTIRICILRIVAAVAAVYGVYVFVKRDIGNYILLKIHFVFFDYDEPLFFFLLDYIAVMGLFIFIGHYLFGYFKTLFNN